MFHLRSSIFRLPSSLLLVLTACGCGGDEYPLARVSGTVTLDGAPVADARVGFEPVRQGDGLDAGPGSYGKTDQQGRFWLKTLHGQQGAVVGPHVVRITTIQAKDSGPLIGVLKPSLAYAERAAEEGFTLVQSAGPGGSHCVSFRGFLSWLSFVAQRRHQAFHPQVPSCSSCPSWWFSVAERVRTSPVPWQGRTHKVLITAP